MNRLPPAPNNNKIIKIIGLGLIAAILAIGAIFVIKDKNTSSSNIIAHEETNFGPLWITQEEGQRCLTFIKPPSPIIQSCMNISNPKKLLSPYNQMFLSTLFLNDNPQRILVIGLGGAALQKTLNILLPQTLIDTVEINPALPKIVEKHFNYKENKYNKIYVEDAATFAEKASPSTYDIIFIDAFNEEYIPSHLLTDQFMKDVKHMLSDNGVVAINTFTVSKTFRQESDLFKRNFGPYFNLIFNKSRVMISTKNEAPNLDDITQKAIYWKFKFIEVGVDEIALLKLYHDPI